MALIAWLVCLSVVGALVYIGLNGVAGLRDACLPTDQSTPVPGTGTALPIGVSPQRGTISQVTGLPVTILPPGPRNQPNGNGHASGNAVTPAVHQPKSRKPGQQA